MDLAPTVDAVFENELLSDRKLGLPLVSLVMVNRNYAAYLERAIRSIRQQNYPWFECAIVDDASTDDSIGVIERAVADDPRFTVIRLNENLGQLGALLRIFDRIRGSFVVVVDADDMLFPEFISSHVQVHLSLPQTVSFTSSNVVEIDADDRVLTGGRLWFAVNCESEPRGLKSADAVVRLTTISDADYEQLSKGTITVPHWKLQWVWAPGTANMFRKAALELALPDVSQIRGHAGCDNYFCPILHLMTGSALISRRLSAYRFHGRNDFGSSPSMKAVRTQRRFVSMRDSVQRLVVLQTFLSRAAAFNFILQGDRLWPTIDLLSGIEGMTPRAYFAQDAVQDILAENFLSLNETFGAQTVLAELCERLDAAAVWRLIGRAHGGHAPLSLKWAFAKETARRFARNPLGALATSGLKTPREPIVEQMASDPIDRASQRPIFPAIFTPGIENNALTNADGIWIDGWSAARAELTLSGGEEGLISIEGVVPNVTPSFRSRLIVSVNEQQVGTLDFEPGDVSAVWPIPSSDLPRTIVLEFAEGQALASPDTRYAAMLIREIAVRPSANFDGRDIVLPSKMARLRRHRDGALRFGRNLFGLSALSDARASSRPGQEPILAGEAAPIVARPISPTVSMPGVESSAPTNADDVVPWRSNLIYETIRWANERRPTLKVCNICGFSGYFQPHWFPVAPEAKCPQCFSLERHRLLKLWFDEHVAVFSGARVLHFAAEPAVTRFIKPPSREYVTADIAPGRGDLEINIEAIDLPDLQFDVVVCSHVLEHVDDRHALKELYRVVKPAGTALLMFPVVEGWATTYEDPSKKTVEERWQHFGQGDHVRRYGSDVRHRIVEAGFVLEEFTAVEPYVTQHGLTPGEKLFVAEKSAS